VCTSVFFAWFGCVDMRRFVVFVEEFFGLWRVLFMLSKWFCGAGTAKNHWAIMRHTASKSTYKVPCIKETCAEVFFFFAIPILRSRKLFIHAYFYCQLIWVINVFP
jgi:hypothetical protein